MSVASDTLARVLIVDDNPDIHKDIRKILAPRQVNEALDVLESLMFGQAQPGDSNNSFLIEDAYQGQDALQMVIDASQRQDAFDLAIVDMRMPPGWDGLQTIEKLWDYDPDIQIIICTAFSDYSWDEIADRLGLQDKLLILKKPFDDCELLQAVRALSEKRRLLSQARYNLDTLQLLVTQRSRELESVLKESESLLGAISSGLVAYDAFGVVTRWNGVAEKLFGIKAEDALSKVLLELSIPWQEPQIVHEFFRNNQFLNGKRTEVVVHSPDDATISVELSLHPVINKGLPVGGLMLVDDVTVRRELEHQLNQSQKLEAVGQLAAGIAHEINTPMQYVGDNVQYLQSVMQKVEAPLRLVAELSRAEVDERTEVVDQLCQSSGAVKLDRLLEQIPQAIQDVELGIANVVRIVQAMKELSHPGTDKPAALDIHRILESAIVVSKSEWKHIADVETAFEPHPPGMVGYANQLQQVFLNLLVNAAHAIDARYKTEQAHQGHIRVATMLLDNRFLISFQDNGAGIPEEIRDRVYNPFFTTKGVGKGTGQGLALAHQIIVKNHSGRLWFDSTVGIGTTFFVELPVDEQAGIFED